MKYKVNPRWQSKQWFVVAVFLFGLLRLSYALDYGNLNLLNYHLNKIVNPAIFQIPSITSQPNTINNFLNYRLSTPQENLKIRFLQAQANLSMLLNKDQAALQLWEQIPSDHQQFFYNSELARQSGLLESSLQWLRWGAQIHPEVGDWDYMQALVYNDLGMLDLALIHAEKSLEQPLQRIGNSDIYFIMGSIWAQKDEVEAGDNAVSNFEKAIASANFQYEANLIDAYFSLAEILRDTGQEEKALPTYLQVIEDDPNHYSANLWVGSLYWTLEEDLDKALLYLNKAVALDPNRKWAYRNLGMIFQETGSLPKARELYTQVLAIDPGDSFAKQQLEILAEE